MEPRANRYAVPLSTLVAGAYVPLAEQVEVQDVAAPLPPAGLGTLPLGEGGDVDGDGE